jgi:hypothetical protein
MTVAEAAKELSRALAAGALVAIARDKEGDIVDIPQREWPYLQLFEEGGCRHATGPAFPPAKQPKEPGRKIYPPGKRRRQRVGKSQQLSRLSYFRGRVSNG